MIPPKEDFVRAYCKTVKSATPEQAGEIYDMLTGALPINMEEQLEAWSKDFTKRIDQEKQRKNKK